MKKRLFIFIAVFLAITITFNVVIEAKPIKTTQEKNLTINGEKIKLIRKESGNTVKVEALSGEKKAFIEYNKDTEEMIVQDENNKVVHINLKEIKATQKLQEGQQAEENQNQDSLIASTETSPALILAATTKYKYYQGNTYKWNGKTYKWKLYKRSSGSGKKWKFYASKGSSSKTRYGNSINVKWDRYMSALDNAEEQANYAIAEIGVGGFAAIVGSIVAMVASGGSLTPLIIVGMLATYGAGSFTAAKDIYDAYQYMRKADRYYADL